jgi:hypothetical protein
VSQNLAGGALVVDERPVQLAQTSTSSANTRLSSFAQSSRHSRAGSPGPKRSARPGRSSRIARPKRWNRLADEREQQKRQELKRALQKELAEFPNPRPFDPKGRYKAGEIIVHAEHGRGKIENVLKSSLLVRFLEGLRPLDLS